MIDKNKLKNFQGKRIGFIGLGEENFSLIKFLLKKGVKAHLTVCDERPVAEIGDRYFEIRKMLRRDKKEVAFMTGKNYDAYLTDFDIVFRSPGYPLFENNLLKAKKAGVIITSPMKAFMDLCPTKNVVGITGSKGKGTTSSLIYEVIKAGGKKAYLGGNIGIAPFDFIEKIKPSDFVVLELSSFQLEDFDRSPKIAVMTNLFKEHLAPADPKNPNYHKTMKAYWEAKANVFKHQKKGDYLVVNKKLASYIEKEKFSGKTVFYEKSDIDSNLIGEHNKENVAAAAEVAKILKIKEDAVKKAVKKFQGLPHRLELVAERGGVRYFDDSFATVPDVSVIALKSFAGDKNIVLLAGGADKGSDFKDFVREINKRVKYLILFKGAGSDKIVKELKAKGYKLKMKKVDNMKDAMETANSQAKEGDIVMLSTGCASFGCFLNYKDRGDRFKKEALKSNKR